ncbi:MAG: type IV pilin [Candidatus Micrarchaeota archaeon]
MVSGFLRGVSPIISVVLLLAVAAIAAAGVCTWTSGLQTKPPTASTPSERPAALATLTPTPTALVS